MMRNRGLVVALAVALANSEGHAQGGGGGDEPQLLILTVGAVRVATSRPGGGGWDQPVAPRDNKSLCGALGILAHAAALGSGTGVAGACQLLLGATDRQRQRNPQMPDLFVAIEAGSNGYYRTATAQDSAAASFRARIQVPVASIPSTGLQVQVLDDDGDEGNETLGSIRVSRDDLLRAAGARDTLQLTDDSGVVQKLELTVEGRMAKKYERTEQFDTRNPVTSMASLPVDAGMLVFIEARGSYKAGPWAGLITVEGKPTYPNQPAMYRLPAAPFSTARHGMAVALVGAGASVKPLLVGKCAGHIVETAGTIALGVNDSDVANNQGSIEFRVTAIDSLPAYWEHPGLEVPCSALAEARARGAQQNDDNTTASEEAPPPKPMRPYRRKTSGSDLRSPFE